MKSIRVKELFMRYTLERTTITDPSIESAEWGRAQIGRVCRDRWTEYEKTPETTFKMLRGPQGISLLLHTAETHLRAECREENGDVYLDSCMELFIKPDNLDTRYLNFEVNPRGVLHLGLGSGRHGRTLLDTDRATFSIVSVANEGDWTVKLYIPDSFILEHFERMSGVMKANVYKCGEGTDHVHFGSWCEVEVDAPDFHQPDFFGFIVT